MTLWCCVTPERERKTSRIMVQLSRGTGGRLTLGSPPPGPDPFAVWGQAWLALRAIPPAIDAGRPFWQIDNGFYRPAGGSAYGYYRFTYRSMAAILLRDPPRVREQLEIAMRPWRREGRHILLALPGRDFGKAMGLPVPRWIAGIVARLRAATDRPVIVRPKGDPTPLFDHLRNCWALVTHSSNVAVDAVIAGVPVFVEPTSPAAPVGRTDFDFEHPAMPDRAAWWASLMAQQFSLDEMGNGFACARMTDISNQVDRRV
jgi:hypothetical protein